MRSDAQGIGTITDDDPTPSLSINDVTVAEGNASFTTANFTLILSAASGLAVSVCYATENDSASSGDYTCVSGILNFAAGVTSRTITVSINRDALNAVIADAQAIRRILNDDGI